MKLASRVGHLRAALTGKLPVSFDGMRYAGGAMSRVVANWFAVLEEANDEIRWSLETLRARSRQVVRDNGEAAGLLLDFESDIAGPNGAQLQFRATRPRGAPVPPLNDRVERRFRRWAKRGNCTLGPAMSFAALQRLMIRTVIQDGEFLALRVRDSRLSSGYRLQVIDADLLDENENRRALDGLNAIVMGVEINAEGRPVAYHLWDRHPSLPGRVKRPVPAEDVLHVFKAVRPGQLRGVPWMAPVLVTWKMGARYSEAELYQSLLAASQSGFFVDKQGTTNIDVPRGTDGKPKALQLELVPGVSRQLPAGLEFQPWEPKHPTANFVGFMKAINRLKARAFGRSYASLTGDLSDVNFSSMRIDREREKAQNRVHQQELLVEQFCEVIFADWVQMAALVGELGVVGFDTETMIEFSSWMTIGWQWIDPVKDATAAQMELNMGTTSPQRICAEKGRDYFDVIDEIAEAREYAKEKKVNLDVVPLAITIAADANPDLPPSNTEQKGRVLPLRTGTA